MKSTVELLTPKERQALAHLYGTPAFDALKRLHQLEVIGLGKDALDAQDLQRVHFLKGAAHQSKKLIQLIGELYKTTEKS